MLEYYFINFELRIDNKNKYSSYKNSMIDNKLISNPSLTECPCWADWHMKLSAFCLRSTIVLWDLFCWSRRFWVSIFFRCRWCSWPCRCWASCRGLTFASCHLVKALSFCFAFLPWLTRKIFLFMFISCLRLFAIILLLSCPLSGASDRSTCWLCISLPGASWGCFMNLLWGRFFSIQYPFSFYLTQDILYCKCFSIRVPHGCKFRAMLTSTMD